MARQEQVTTASAAAVEGTTSEAAGEVVAEATRATEAAAAARGIIDSVPSTPAAAPEQAKTAQPMIDVADVAHAGQ